MRYRPNHLALVATLAAQALLGACTATGRSGPLFGEEPSGAGSAGIAGAAGRGETGGTAGAAGGTGTAGIGAAGGTAGFGGAGGTAGTGNGSCIKSSAEVGVSVDVILVLDGSGSMGDDIEGIADNLNSAFVEPIAGSNLSWRLTVVAPKQGVSSASTNSLCVPSPPAGPSCSDALRFTHVHCAVESTDAFASLGYTYGGVLPPYMPAFGAMVCGGVPGYFPTPSWDGKQWKDSMRLQATKVILAITDDESDVEASAFDTWLTTQAEPAGMFGSPEDRRYLFFGILGHQATDKNAVCETAEGPAPAVGKKYQALAALTGGTTLSICEGSWASKFNDLAGRMIDQLGCVYDVPRLPEGETLDPKKVNLRYTPGGGATEVIGQDADWPCDAGANGWQWSSDKKKLLLCGAACQRVKSDPEGKVVVEVGCQTVEAVPRP